MMDDQLDEQLRDLAGDYHRPPETPRDEMWTAIQRDRASRRAPKRIGWKPLVWGGLAAAAVLTLGIFIGGRMRSNGNPQVAEETGTESGINLNGPDRAFKVAAVQ